MTVRQNPLERLILRLTSFQVRHPVLVLLLAACTLLPSALAIRGLELKTGFGELLRNVQPLSLRLNTALG